MSVRFWMLFLSVFALVWASCTPSQSYSVKGRVVGFGDDRRTLIIDHEAVPGVMEAMTMSFKARGDSLPPLDRGDAVGFTLVLTPDGYWIEDVQPLPDDAVAASPAGDALGIDPTADDLLLSPGEAVPPFTLIDQDGDPVTLDTFAEQAVVLTFIYTRCPFPEQCPLLSQRFRTLQPTLRERFGDRVHLLSISFDTDYDTPEVLRTYARQYTQTTDTWTFATGEAEQVRRLAEQFGVFYTGDGASTFEHNLTTAVIGPEGRIVDLWRTNDWHVDDVLNAVRRALGASS